MPGFRFEPLGGQAGRADFTCGVEPLDRYLRTQAGQDVRRRVAVCFLMMEGDTVAGYYTLSATSVLLADRFATVLRLESHTGSRSAGGEHEDHEEDERADGDGAPARTWVRPGSIAMIAGHCRNPPVWHQYRQDAAAVHLVPSPGSISP